MFTTNHELARIFAEMAAIYELLDGGNRFRVRAYENAARVVDGLPEDVRTYSAEELEAVKGIGESIAGKIREYVDSGHIAKYEELRGQVPEDFIGLLRVEGIGPKTLQTLRRELGVDSKERLVDALKSGAVSKLKGFGEKTVENILNALTRHEQASGRILLAEALQIAHQISTELKPCLDGGRLEIAGSIRRRRETIGDIDVLIAATPADRARIVDCFVNMPGVEKVIAKGKTKASVMVKSSHRDVDLRIVDAQQWGAALLYFTGSKSHNLQLRRMARQKDWKINEYGLYRNRDNKKLAGETEASIYKKLGLAWIPPEMREANGEIELAARDALPELIEGADIRGDLQMHSDWSDGVPSIDELARYVIENYHYEYIVLTDHSKSARVAGGLDEKAYRRQFKAIEEVNKRLGREFVKKGAEVDILADGTLDLSDKLLAEFEWVVASIHSRFHEDNTGRLLRAMDSPYVNAIGHPTGRLIGQRDAYPLDREAVVEHAAATGTALEINSQPLRMDLDDQWSRATREGGAMLVISTDSHNLGGFATMDLGVAVARRAWCTKKEVLNTRKWRDLEQFVKKKRP